MKVFTACLWRVGFRLSVLEPTVKFISWPELAMVVPRLYAAGFLDFTQKVAPPPTLQTHKPAGRKLQSGKCIRGGVGATICATIKCTKLPGLHVAHQFVATKVFVLRNVKEC